MLNVQIINRQCKRKKCTEWTHEHSSRCQYLGQQLCSIMQVLPVNPGSQVVHNPFLDLFLYPVVSLSLQLQGLVVILPLIIKQKWRQNTPSELVYLPSVFISDILLSAMQLRNERTHPLKVEKIFFEGLSGLSLLALVDDIRVFFVAAAFIVFTAMSLPVTKTHPAEVLKITQYTIINQGSRQM